MDGMETCERECIVHGDPCPECGGELDWVRPGYTVLRCDECGWECVDDPDAT